MNVKAVINGDRIECGKCGALLAKFKKINEQDDCWRFAVSYEKNTEYDDSKMLFEIKCKHKDKGLICNIINEILL